MMTDFRTFIQTARASNNPRGDFIGDAKDDDGLPNATTWEELESYLHGCRACHEAIDAGKVVWDEFKRWRPHDFRRGRKL
jgi:YozE SAM-like fold